MRAPFPRRRSALVLLFLPFLVPTDSAHAAASAEPVRPSAVAPGGSSTSDPATEEAVREAVETALEALGPHVATMSHDDALTMAFRAYYRYRTAHPERVRKPYLYYVDYGLDNATARGYVFDMDELTLVDGPFMVAHGTGSSDSRNTVPTRFSNRPGSKMSSLGLYLAQETYGFRGRAGGRSYSSVGLRMKGESGTFNDAARRRGIVAHGAPYVTARDAGRSEGCPAMDQARAKRLLPMIANGGMVFLFSPRDRRWLEGAPWAGVEPARAD